MTAKKSKKAKVVAKRANVKAKRKKIVAQTIPPVAEPPVDTAAVHKIAFRTRFERVTANRNFGRGYLVFAVVVLLGSAVFWSLLSGRVNMGNADQLINPYLFENANTLHAALLPGAHSFLLKWPIFALIRGLGFSSAAYLTATVGLVLITVSGLAAIMYRIERRPIVFGTLCLSLSSVLIVVPAEPYAGGLLPVNMAMITTRNIEYVVFIVCLALLAKTRRPRLWRYGLALSGLAVLIASDKLFLSLSLGGAVIGGIGAVALRNRELLRVFTRQLVATIIAGITSVGLLVAVSSSHLTRIVNQAGASPYGLVDTLHGLLLATIYAVLGVLTNFGANPAAGTTILRDLPRQSLATLTSLAVVNVLINGAVLLAGLAAVLLVVRARFSKKASAHDLSTADTLALMLICSSLAAGLAFVVTKHDYAVDARYLSLSVFTVFISLATISRRRVWPTGGLTALGILLLVGVVSGAQIANHSAQQQLAAAAPYARRNAAVAQVVAHHPVDTLVGDYWRVVPTKFRAGPAAELNILPLASCSQIRDTLTSTAWQHDLHKHSFAYLLTLDGSQTDYPRCSYAQVVTAYGNPNASALIAGTFDNPKEVVLFYDNGTIKPTGSAPANVGLESILSIPANKITGAACSDPTVVNIVAHQDDDLLFMNPDIMRDIQAGKCVRTVYVTAGDSGNGRYYTLGREQGSEAAYSTMLGRPTVWSQHTVKLADKQFVTIATPKDNSKISLVFMHLPDGGIHGLGFSATHHESLDRLGNTTLRQIHSEDKQSVYTSSQLVQALVTVLRIYQPSEIRTQSAYADSIYPDHSDHRAVGRYAQSAQVAYDRLLPAGGGQIPILFYVGYPVHGFVENVTGQDLADKTAAFLAYAHHDGAVCQNALQCGLTSTYNAYLRTEYQSLY